MQCFCILKICFNFKLVCCVVFYVLFQVISLKCFFTKQAIGFFHVNQFSCGILINSFTMWVVDYEEKITMIGLQKKKYISIE